MCVEVVGRGSGTQLAVSEKNKSDNLGGGGG